MKLLSEELATTEYTALLKQDLERATVLRFLVAYVSWEGLNLIGRDRLTGALRGPHSFGVASLSCACGYKPLLRLQQGLQAASGLRLKYFMDPLVRDPESPADLALFHSKLVYLFLEREAKSVVYIGSHNWSRRALGPGRPRSAEASLRNQ